MKSKVYFTDLHTRADRGLPTKLDQLICRAGIGQIDFEKKYVAVKLHFGEPGNLSFLRPNYAKTLCDRIKALGGKPFVTDCNTLYVGRRKDALEHLDAAYENGYNPFCTGVHTIIADGIKGTDEALVPIPGEYVRQAKIGKALMDADIVISLNHFKGHELTGFGGAIKNLGMGGGSRAGKMEMHAAGKPEVEQSACVGCGFCAKNCAHGAITLTDRKAFIDHDLCVGCGRCIGNCRFDAIHEGSSDSNDMLSKKIAEYALAVVQDRPHFHVSLIVDVSPNCDCHNENDLAILPNIGMLASFDPVALDQACADLCNQAEAIRGSVLAQQPQVHGDHFINNHPVTDWRVCLEHAEKMGVGVRDYELEVME